MAAQRIACGTEMGSGYVPFPEGEGQQAVAVLELRTFLLG